MDLEVIFRNGGSLHQSSSNVSKPLIAACGVGVLCLIKNKFVSSLQDFQLNMNQLRVVALATPIPLKLLAEMLIDYFDMKINGILSIILQDEGDSFAKRAEMYYQKRPQLIQMVEDLHKSYRSLADKYEQLRSQLNHGSHPTLLSSLSSPVNQVQGYVELNAEDPDLETEFDDDVSNHVSSKESKMKAEDKIRQGEKKKRSNGIGMQRNTSDGYEAAMLENEKLWNELRFKVSELVEDNLSHQAELIRRNDEKREIIRDLCSKMKMDENKALTANNTRSQVSRLKRLFLGKFMK
ncbi:hypothetical protein Godav_014215 [Gossypium davidsonii]|uniref:NAB domain-containing protein n=1 Tax=Gossypium davidsonii TaxID=34287 RepID=A0A7J8RJ24_GOSDV|nr:hypothetical protein [Gossypium davidsonii]